MGRHSSGSGDIGGTKGITLDDWEEAKRNIQHDDLKGKENGDEIIAQAHPGKELGGSRVASPEEAGNPDQPYIGHSWKSPYRKNAQDT